MVEVLRPPACPLTADGVKVVDSMMAGLEAEFTVSVGHEGPCLGQQDTGLHVDVWLPC